MPLIHNIDRESSDILGCPIYAEHHEVRANRIDARIVSHKDKNVTMLEMNCPWIENRDEKNQEKLMKYGPLTWELKKHYITRILGRRGVNVLANMQKAVIFNSLNIGRTFKIQPKLSLWPLSY